MQDEHGFIWLAMLDAVGPISGSKVLDVGCNRGGFLRLLVDRSGIAEGFGYDPAPGAIEDAKRLRADRPLTFVEASMVPPDWSGFDVAFSHEVLYVVDDLDAHARSIHRALHPGGSYFATMGMHRHSRLMTRWYETHHEELSLPALRTLDEVATLFERAGFEVAAGRLPIRFAPIRAHRENSSREGTLLEWLEYYYEDKVMFRLTKPIAN